MALSADKKAMLKHLAAAGDLAALEALSLEATGRAGLVSLGAVAAKSVTGIHASVFGDAVGPVVITTALSAPARARNASVVAGATYDGGTVSLTGLNQFGLPQTEDIIPVAGTTVYGTKIWKSVSQVAYPGGGVGTHATNTLSIGTGDKIGALFDVLDTMGMGLMQATAGAANTPEAVTVDPTNNAVTFTTVPDGTKVLIFVGNL